MKIYLASSWRNPRQPEVVNALRAAGHEVYDFRNPAPGNHGFAWSSISPYWEKWSPKAFRLALTNPIAEEGFQLDSGAMEWADAIVLLLPCGRSAHLELGWGAGSGRYTAVLMEQHNEPELMYKLCDYIALNVEELLEWLRLCEGEME